MYMNARYKYTLYLDSSGEVRWSSEIDPQAPASNTWSAIFIPWFVHDKCQMPVALWERQTGQTFLLTEDEQKFVQLHLSGVAPTVVRQKMAWRRLTIEDDFKGNVQRFNQEFPATPTEGFVTSGENAFNPHQILSLLNAAPKPIAKYEMDPRTGQVLTMPEGRLWVWEEPRAGLSYYIAADVAKGIVVDENTSDEDSKHDNSCTTVKEHLTGREVAQFYGKIDPDLYGEMLYGLHVRYNMAWVIPESNSIGNTVISALLRRGCKKIYVEKRERPPNKPTREYGIQTMGGSNGGVRGDMVNALIASVRDGRHGIRSSRTFKEFLTIVRTAKGRYEAQSGRHDDAFMAEAIAKYAGPLLPLPANAPPLGAPVNGARAISPAAAGAVGDSYNEGWM
jgi:hypothetical protein